MSFRAVPKQSSIRTVVEQSWLPASTGSTSVAGSLPGLHQHVDRHRHNSRLQFPQLPNCDPDRNRCWCYEHHLKLQTG